MYTYTQCYDNIYICVQYIHRYAHTCAFICSNVLYILHIMNMQFLHKHANICAKYMQIFMQNICKIYANIYANMLENKYSHA